VTESKAFYDRSSFSFFEFTHDGKSTFSEESTAVVAHKIGHGLLDAIRDLWDTPFLEASAFRESFVTASLCLLRSPTPNVSGIPSADHIVKTFSKPGPRSSPTPFAAGGGIRTLRGAHGAAHQSARKKGSLIGPVSGGPRESPNRGPGGATIAGPAERLLRPGDHELYELAVQPCLDGVHENHREAGACREP